MLAATLLRLCFPSWAFFDRVGTPPRLELCPVHADGRTGGWRAAFDAPRRRWWHVAWHPLGTRTLAAQVAVERWHAALDAGAPHDDDDAGDATTRAHVAATARALAAACAAAMPEAGPGITWRLRLVEGTGTARRVVHEGPVALAP